MRLKLRIIVIIIVVALLLSLVYIFTRPTAKPIVTLGAPTFETEVLVPNLSNPWDIAFLPTGEMLFTERNNKISLFRDGVVRLLAEPKSTYVNGEGGMMSIVVHPKFIENRNVYTCSNVNINGKIDVRVHRWELTENFELKNPDTMVRGIPSNDSGRHSGCQMEFGPDGNLWIGTGDTAVGTTSQDPKSLGGKILRVDDKGRAVAGNLAAPYDSRIFSSGHRNLQGLTFLKNKSSEIPVGVSAEHGPDKDDELNMIVAGNFGWDPVGSDLDYNEDVSMTDKIKYPDAIDPVWTSGDSTIAISGITQITGEKWGIWNGAIAVAALKGQQVRIMEFESENKLAEIATILTDIGRIRTIQEGPDGNLYILTDNGNGNDSIIKIIPNV